MAAASAQTVLITGASRGIGLGLVDVYAKKGWRVIAAARDPAKAAGLQALVKANPKSVSTVTLDVSDSKSIAALPAALAEQKVGAVDLLINNAGINGLSGAPTTLSEATVEVFHSIYRTNVIGVWETTQVLLPLLRKSKAPKLANISSTMGSITETLTQPFAGLAVAYRCSKAAMNELGAVQSREYNEATVKALASADAAVRASAAPLITVLQINPGWVDTDLGNSAGTALGKPPVTLVQSAGGIEVAIAAAQPNAKAVFVDFENKPVGW